MVSPLCQGAKRSTREFAMICRPSAWAHDKNLAVSTLLSVWLVNEGPKMQGHETPCKNVASILCGYMVQELLCNHLVAPIFGSPRAMFCRNLFEFCILRKWSHLEVPQKAWLLPLGHWVAADSTGPKARRKHKSDAVEHVVVSCRCCGGCCGRCRCSSRCSCAWYGWPPSCFESWKARPWNASCSKPVAKSRHRPGRAQLHPRVPYLCWVYRDYISPNLHLHFAHINICLAEVALNLHRITCLFTLSISFQSCGRRRNAAGCWNRLASWAPKTWLGS